MNRHGFVRRREFTVAEKRGDAVSLVVEGDAESKKQYPYDFRFTVTYTLTGSSITTEFKVETRAASRRRSVGGHPGFNPPVAEGEVFEDYDIVFEKPETQKRP